MNRISYYGLTSFIGFSTLLGVCHCFSFVRNNAFLVSSVASKCSSSSSKNSSGRIIKEHNRLCQMNHVATSINSGISLSRDQTRLMMKGDASNDDDEEEEDDYIDDSALGDWRTFRSSLVGSGLTSPESENLREQSTNEEQLSSSSASSSSSSTSTQTSKEETEKDISPNVELLFSQSDKLGEEYLTGAWAHESPGVEIGGLVVRLPLEAEIYKNGEKTSIGKKLIQRMDVEEVGSNGSSYLSLGSSSSDEVNLSFSLVAAQTLLWYKKAQKLIEEEMMNVAELANERGEIDPQKLDDETMSLLHLYLDNQNSWQEVCLVADRDASKGTSTTFVLNRPMAFSVSNSLARLVLFGALDASLADRITPRQSKRLVLFKKAFENMCAIYVGGPDNMEAPAVMLHGYGEIEGAVEIAPGTKVYKGGIDGAIEGILSGKYNPLDFRFFVGCYEYKNGDLDVAVNANKYQTIACGRPVILKQCIQLPKPLWHEILELCGGELMEMSKLELMKRDDLKN